jgi:alkanesulfonate monooxygenase SsuD/methylene tetrahydromethanopterin reductase-like flavin-dependent oxidoreductase (luciferase family)
MEFGYFAMPSHPPERGLKAGHDWDLQTLRWLDELGYTEAWIGEHHTAPWEPHPAPDLLIAQALMQTKRIRIGPGGFLLPYHHPMELANRVAMLDHLSEGRLNFGVAASGLPTDWAMFQVDGMTGVNREMTREALDIILGLWSDEPSFIHKGKFWTVEKPEPMFGFLKPHIYPLQKPNPPIGVAGLSKQSDTLKLAGERGYLPLSLNLNPAYVASHWEAVEIGAARTGRTPKRSDWRLVREVFVAETDEEAWRLSVGGMMGRMMREYFLRLLGNFGFLEYLKHDQSVADSDVTAEYCARHNWLIGSPATVAETLERIYHEAGGFGGLLVFGFDYADNPEVWHNSLRLLAEEVGPRVAHLKPS